MRKGESIYVGRIVGIGRTSKDENFGIYRVSSNSYPNRSAVINNDEVLIKSKIGAEKENEMSPYVEYKCIKILERCAIISNGEHTGSIAQKIAAGQEPQDALARTLTDMGYEHDDYLTPRIAGIIPSSGDYGWLATVRYDELVVKRVNLTKGNISYIATYEHNSVDPNNIIRTTATTSHRLAKDAVNGTSGWANLEKPVTSAVILWSHPENKVNLAVADVI